MKVNEFQFIKQRIDKAQFKGNKQLGTSVSHCKISQFRNRKKFTRAGVIPYTVIDDEIYLCMGVDTISGSLTDFGGGVKYADKGSLNAGLREFKEESLGVFHDDPKNKGLFDNIGDDIIIKSDRMVIMFIKFNYNFSDISKSISMFDYRYKNSKSMEEVKEIRWLDRNELLDILHNTKKWRQMYRVVRIVLQGATNVIANLN